MTPEKLQMIIEAALMVAGRPLTVAALQNLFAEDEKPSAAEIKEGLAAIQQRFAETGIELREVASGFRFQTKASLSPWLSKLWEERAPRYSRAFLETLAIIAYKQPVTRAEIEEIRGVTVSSHIIKTMMEREWVKVLGYKDVPGKPAIYGTTKTFLDHFNLKNLSALPPLAEFKDLESQEVQVQLALQQSDIAATDSETIAAENTALIQDENHHSHSQDHSAEELEHEAEESTT